MNNTVDKKEKYRFVLYYFTDKDDDEKTTKKMYLSERSGYGGFEARNEIGSAVLYDTCLDAVRSLYTLTPPDSSEAWKVGKVSVTIHEVEL